MSLSSTLPAMAITPPALAAHGSPSCHTQNRPQSSRIQRTAASASSSQRAQSNGSARALVPAGRSQPECTSGAPRESSAARSRLKSGDCRGSSPDFPGIPEHTRPSQAHCLRSGWSLGSGPRAGEALGAAIGRSSNPPTTPLGSLPGYTRVFSSGRASSDQEAADATTALPSSRTGERVDEGKEGRNGGLREGQAREGAGAMSQNGAGRGADGLEASGVPGEGLPNGRRGDPPVDSLAISSADPAHQSADSRLEAEAATGSNGTESRGGGHAGEGRITGPGGSPGNAFGLGIELSSETAAIALVYFVQGILGLSRLAVTFFLKDDFNLDPAEVAILTGASAFPWLIKPLYGFISDGIPLFGYRRRSYLIASGLTGALSWLLMASVVNDKYAAVAMIVLSSLAAAVSDVVVDSMVVARARGEPQSVSGSLQSLCWGSSAAGAVLSAYFSGSLVEQWGPRSVFAITALLPLITTGVGFFVPEERVGRGLALGGPAVGTPPVHPRDGSGPAADAAQESRMPLATDSGLDLGGNAEGVPGGAPLWESLKGQLGQLRDVFGVKEILFPTIFIFFWQATPHSETAMFFYTTNVLGLGPEFLGRVRLVTAMASLGGVALYNFCLRSTPLRRIFLWSNIVGTVLGASQLIVVLGLNRAWGISDQYFLLGDSLILAVLGQVSFMPVLVLAARVCPPGIEATLFASLMSVSNGAGVVGGLVGAGLTQALHVTSADFHNLALLLAICNFSSLLALPLLGLLPADDRQADPAAADKEE